MFTSKASLMFFSIAAVLTSIMLRMSALSGGNSYLRCPVSAMLHDLHFDLPSRSHVSSTPLGTLYGGVRLPVTVTCILHATSARRLSKLSTTVMWRTSPGAAREVSAGVRSVLDWRIKALKSSLVCPSLNQSLRSKPCFSVTS